MLKKLTDVVKSIAQQGTSTHEPSRDTNPPQLGCPAGRTPQPPQCVGHPHLLCLFVSFAQPTCMQHPFVTCAYAMLHASNNAAPFLTCAYATCAYAMLHASSNANRNACFSWGFCILGYAYMVGYLHAHIVSTLMV